MIWDSALTKFIAAMALWQQLLLSVSSSSATGAHDKCMSTLRLISRKASSLDSGHYPVFYSWGVQKGSRASQVCITEAKYITSTLLIVSLPWRYSKGSFISSYPLSMALHLLLYDTIVLFLRVISSLVNTPGHSSTCLVIMVSVTWN